MTRAFRLWILVAAAVAQNAAAADLEELPIGETAERHLPGDEPFMQWVQDPARVASNLSDTFATRDKLEDELETIKLTGLVPPVYFASGVAEIPASTVEALRIILARMQHRRNVRLHLVGHADSQPLSDALVRLYGDNLGLSRERAGEVAEFLQTELALPAEAISYDWRGDTDPAAGNATPEGRALNRRVEVEVWYDEVRAKVVQEEVLVAQDVQRVKVCRVQTVCKLSYVDDHEKRARIRNLVAPLHYGDESIAVDEDFVGRVRQALVDLGDKRNVVVRFIGHTDDTPLSGRMERIYGTAVGLSKARARRVALAMQDALDLPTPRIASDGRGAAKPLAANDTPHGRALNRRVEVEFWYDDPLQQLPDEPQLCPDAPGAELVTKVYDPPWGPVEPIGFGTGDPVVPAGLTDDLRRAMDEIAERRNVRLRFTGYTRNGRLDRRTALVYGDAIGLSASRARRAMEAVAGQMQLAPSQSEFEGRGYVYADDVVNAGFVQGDTSYVKVEVVYDELAVLDDYEGVEITKLQRELSPQNPFGLNVMRITVDGQPIDDPERSSADIQRCTDVALEEADIRFGFDNLRSDPRLGVSAAPVLVETETAAGPPDAGSGEPAEKVPAVRFTMYANYSYFIDRAEVRIFEAGASTRSEPLAAVAIGPEGTADWRPPTADAPEALRFVLRAYGHDGNFDETEPRPLQLGHGNEPGTGAEQDPPAAATLAAAWGENGLVTQNIGLGSGTVTVQGSGIPAGHEVWVAGHRVPLDEEGSFVSEEVLPTGMHTVEVAVLEEEGSGELYLRDLEFEEKDWFYVGMADVTLSSSDTTGPLSLLAGRNAPYEIDSAAAARLAFFVDGKFGEHWRLTASADTREAGLDDLFSNFMEKSPDALFRRIDPDYYYPTFGDDGTVTEMAPTSGKFFLRLSEADNFGQWGNFKVAYMQNELARVDRGLYGANLHLEADDTTAFGEHRYAVDAFAAEPGTVASREEFRGTGGSLYFLRRPDILPGSERVRIEIRDKASGLVTGVLDLAPVVDYDIDYLQGRILLAEPLASTADDNLLVRSGALSGDEAYLVVRYEFTPGFEELDAMSTGGQAHYWVGEHVKLGLTSNTNSVGDEDSRLEGADLTLRLDAESWLKLQAASSEGTVSTTQHSNDGGFEFFGDGAAMLAGASATARRADASLGLDRLPGIEDGRLTLYMQEAEAGYSAPGLATLADLRNVGGTLHLPIIERLAIDAKVDHVRREEALRTEAEEVNVRYELTPEWALSAGYRREARANLSPVVSPALEFGERSDAVLQLGYDSREDWSAYVFVQDTLATEGDLPENGRVGAGTTYSLTERMRVEAEASDGDLGPGGRLRTSYRYSESTNLYLNYVLQNEHAGDGLRPGARRGGNLVAGVKSRFSDSASIYQEERYQHGGAAVGLTHATGISFAPTDHLSFGINTDIGTLRDARTGAETERNAAGIDVGWGSDALQLSSGIEYRNDDAEDPDLLRSARVTWLFRNSLKYQLNASGRVLAKFNHSTSESSLGAFYDGGFTEAGIGYAWRPVHDDRLTALAKYTYFYNVPAADQVAVNGTATEFVQKSHVAAVDVTWRLAPALSIGGKYAYRMSQMSLDRENPEFFENDASLYVLRSDWRFREHWDLLVEGRLLAMPDLGERKQGALVVISRMVSDRVKVGLGYNFSEFSDDLTDLDFDHRGFFLNLTGAM